MQKEIVFFSGELPSTPGVNRIAINYGDPKFDAPYIWRCYYSGQEIPPQVTESTNLRIVDRCDALDIFDFRERVKGVGFEANM